MRSRSVLLPILFALVVAAGACQADGPDAPEAEPAPEAPAADPADAAGPSPEGGLTDEEGRAVLMQVYEPLDAFYARTVDGDGEATLPAEWNSPDAVRDVLTRTMAPTIANRFIDQLIMERNGSWTLRPTELILHPHMDTPALEQVTVEDRGDGTFAITERYAASELYGAGTRTNVVRYADGNWRLVDIE